MVDNGKTCRLTLNKAENAIYAYLMDIPASFNTTVFVVTDVLQVDFVLISIVCM